MQRMKRWLILFTLAALAALAGAGALQRAHAFTLGAPLPGTNVTINNGPGDQADAHVSGDWVAYTDGSTGTDQIRYHNLVTGSDAPIPQAPCCQDYLPAISGTTITYTHVDASHQAIFTFDVSTPTALPVELNPQPGSLRQFAAIGGRTVAWEDFGFNPNESEIVIENLDTQVVTRLTNDAVQDTAPAVSPDGSVIVWTKCTLTFTTGCHIWEALQNNGTWTTSQLTSGASEEEFPQTDGTLVVYQSTRTLNGTSVQNIFWQPVSGGVEHQLALSDSARNAHISGNLISFERQSPVGEWDVWVYDLANDTLYQITNTPGDEAFSNLSVTPDGVARVVWTVNEGATGYHVYGFLFPVPAVDSTPPVLTLPTPITVNATSPAGAVVSYTVTASDPDNASTTLTLTCVPPSGSPFPIGTTTVTCQASDPAGNTTAGSFAVTVKGASAQISDLITLVQSFNLKQGIQNSLDVKLQNMQAALTAAQAGDVTTACNQLSAFINDAQAQSGKALTVDQATQLIVAATQIRAVLGC